jgi:hypothetical protein
MIMIIKSYPAMEPWSDSMDIEIVKKLIAMKDARDSALSAEAQGLHAQVRDHASKLEEAKQRLSMVESLRSEVAAEKAMLMQAIGEQTIRLPTVDDLRQLAVNKFVVKIQSAGSQDVISIDLRTVDLSDGEPKVRQHTVEVRRYAVMVTLQTGPRSTSELITEFEKLGFRVADENEVANLSAILSRTSFFKSENRRWHLDTSKLLAAPRRLPT